MLSLLGKMGLDEGLSYYIPRYSKSSPRQILPIIGYALLATIVLSMFLGGVVTLFADTINCVVFKMPNFEIELRTVVFVLPCFSVLMISLAGLRGIERSDIRAYIYYFGMSGVFLLGLFLLTYGAFHLNNVILLRTGIFAAGGILSLVFVYSLSDHTWERPNKKNISDLQQFSGAVIFISLMQYIIEQPLIDLALVSRFSTPEDVGRYAIASRIGALVAIGLNAFTIVMGPRISAVVHEGDTISITRIYWRTRKWLLSISVAVAVAIFIFADWLLGMFGPEYAMAKPVLLVFALGYCLMAAGGLNLPFMLAYKLQRAELLLELVSLTLMVVGGIILGQLFGAIGVALATVISLAMLNFGRLLVLRKNHL